MAAKTDPTDTGERDVLLGWLAFHRTTLAEKCDGLTEAQLVRAAAPPSGLTLLGLVRHLTIMERVYLSHPLGAAPFDLIYCSDDNPDGDFAALQPGDVSSSMAAWRAERQRVDDALAATTSLDEAAPASNRTVRWLLAKVIQEYARHNGHADIIRERIDGRTGE